MSQAALDHPQWSHNGHVIEVDDPVVGRVREIGPVARMTKTPSVIHASAPAPGAHGDRFVGTDARTPASSKATPACPLAGVTIVEFGYFYAMPFGVTLAGSLGARVIKLEDRGGDPIRSAFGGDAGSAKVTEGKESLSIDLKSPEGQAIAQRLLATADVFVVGFRPGVAERVGLDYETLAAVNPGLVYVHLWRLRHRRAVRQATVVRLRRRRVRGQLPASRRPVDGSRFQRRVSVPDSRPS